MEEEIQCRCNLISATGKVSARLDQNPEDPLPLRVLIFLNRNDDIPGWFLVNNGHDPVDLMILESRHEDGEYLDEAPEPPNWRYSCSDHHIWDDSAGGEDSVEARVEEESVDDEEWLEAEPARVTRAPAGASMFYLDDGDVGV